MRTIVIATGENDWLLALRERHPAPMLPLVDRPFLQHILEFLVRQGMDRFDFVLSHLPQKIEDHFGTGRRWGVSIQFHLAPDPARPYRLLSAICEDAAEPVLLVHADRLPKIELSGFRQESGDMPLVFCARRRDGGALEWTGWAWLPHARGWAWSSDLDEAALAERLLREDGSGGRLIEVDHLLNIQSGEDYLCSQRAVLLKESAELLLGSREVEPGIWIDRNVSLHPTARLDAPVYIGENCRIGRGVRLGPNTVVSRDCVVDAHSHAQHSAVMPGSYVGEWLELDHVMVDRNWLLNVNLETAVSVTDTFLLGSLTQDSFSGFLRGTGARLIAALLLLLAWPVLLFTALWLAVFRRGPVVYYHEMVRLPASEEPNQWKTCRVMSFRGEEGLDRTTSGAGAIFLDFLPALPAVARGRLRFVGVAPRSAAQIRALPPDWQALYLRSKAGIITEAFVQYGAHPSEEELYSAEVFYAAMAGFRHDAALAAGYGWRMLFGR